ncbi:MAG: hypothetical protein QM324_02230 [Bacteroidota bacterium]|jgi:hypothetical protein|nr:hypothetical protein [Bacteroidota bacterium]
MGNTENETRSELLQKIEALRLQLDALEKEVKETLQDAGPLPADPEAQEETPAVSAALPEPQVEAKEPAEDLPQEPIDISISDAEIDVPDFVSKSVKTEPEKTAIKPKKAVMDTRKADKAVMDVMAEKQAWRTDRPGSPVKNIISAISLNDRVLLINSLFKEDPILFRDTIAAFNAMDSLEEALGYIRDHFPDWNMNGGTVYRLMMAVRRKLS